MSLTNSQAEALFNANFSAIQAYKARNGGDWEGAFYAITGQKWPGGQDIKIDPSGTGGHIVKDPGLLKKVAKVAIPVGAAIAAPFTGGTSLYALGAGAGAAEGALNGGVKGALLGGAIGLGAAGLGNAIAGKAATSTMGPTYGPTLEQAGLTASQLPAGAVSGTVASAGSSIWDKIAKATPLISAGASLGGAAIAAHGNTEAAKIEAESAQKALDLQKQVFEQERGDLAPYRTLGYGAVSNLRSLAGVPTVPDQPDLIAPPPAMAPATPITTQAGASSMVPIRDPKSGKVYNIPSARVNEALAQGGQRVGG